MASGFDLQNLANKTVQRLSQAVYGDEDKFSSVNDRDASPSSSSGSAVGSTDGVQTGSSTFDSPKKRKKLYDELELLLDDSVMNNALEIIADDAFGFKTDSKSVVQVNIKDDEEKSKEAQNFLKDKGVLDRVRDATMNTFLLGDEFWDLDGEENKGITKVDMSLHPSLFTRYENEGELYGFGMKTDDETFKRNGKKYRKIRAPWSAIHIRSGMGARQKKKKIPEGVHEGSYGRSGFRGVLQDWKRLNLMENSMTLSRYAKSRKPTFYYIDTSGIKKNEREAYYNEVREKLMKNTSFSEDDGMYRQARELMAQAEPIPHPVHEGQGKIDVQDESEAASAESINDVKYQRNRMFGGIPVPSAYLGLEGELPSGIGQSTLITMSTRYARTVRRLQAQILFGIQRLLRIHYSFKGEIIKADEIEVKTDSMTTAEDLTRAETAEMIAGTFQSIARTIDQVIGRDDEWEYEKLLDEMFKEIDIIDLDAEQLFHADEIENEASDEELEVMSEKLIDIGSVLTREDSSTGIIDIAESTNDLKRAIETSKEHGKLALG